MTEPWSAAPGDAAAAPGLRSAGAWLKAAREREGLHLAVLAATIKVAPAKLQALEQDRYDELPNATFTRALAQSVCRCLKIDPRPVLALLPQLDAQPLDTPVGKLNEPFQPRGARADAPALARVSKPMFIAGGVLLLAALVLGLLPRSLIDGLGGGVLTAAPAASSAAGQASAAAPATAAVAAAATEATTAAVTPADPVTTMEATASAAAGAAAAAPAPVSIPAPAPVAAPALAGASAASGPAAAAAAGLLALHASADSWIEVVDAQERIVFSRVLHAGETAQVEGRPPLRLRVGNAGATTIVLRGQPVDLTPHTRINVARLELR